MTEFRARLDFATHLDFSVILTNPIMDIAARFWESDRYEAFRVCYRSMRMIDDLVDNRKSNGPSISCEEAELLSAEMQRWVDTIRSGDASDEFGRTFLHTCERFDMPLWPWERLCRAMIYDLQHEGFASFLVFARYTEGAAIAPAAVFMHLCGVRKTDGRYLRPAYDIRQAARMLALFSYLVHILRDFEKDQLSNLNYYADTLIQRHHLTRADLKQIAESNVPTPDFRALIQDYHRIAGFYRAGAQRQINLLLPLLEPRYQLSLQMIYGLYNQIFEKVDPQAGQFTTKSLNPSLSEVQARIEHIIEHFVPVAAPR